MATAWNTSEIEDTNLGFDIVYCASQNPTYISRLSTEYAASIFRRTVVPYQMGVSETVMPEFQSWQKLSQSL